MILLPKEHLEQPTKRRVIVVLDSNNYEDVRIDNPYWFTQKKEVLTINLTDDSIQNNELYKKLEQTGLLVNGNILFQDPYDWDNYMVVNNKINEFVLNNAIKKYELFIELCGLLGAKECKCVASRLKNEKGTYSQNIKTRWKIFNFGGNVGNETIKNFDSKCNIHVSFLVTNSIKTMEVVEKFIQDNHLVNNDKFIWLKNLMFNSPIKSYKQTIQTTTESMEILRIAAEISIPGYGLKTDIEKTRKTIETIETDIEIEF